MADHKFERSRDRNWTLGDQKQRILDFMDTNIQLPEVGIYDEPVRYFKANKEWCKLIFGLLDWMEDVAFWPDAQDDNYPGIQAILTFEEGIEGGIFMTPDEFKNALRDGLYEWSNNVAKQIVSGRYTNIAVDEDGNVTDPSTGAGSDIPDDPETPHDEGSEARNGEAIAMARGFKSLYDKCFELFGVDAVPDTPLPDAQFIIKSIFICDETAMDAAVSEYYDVRLAVTGDFIGLNVNQMAEVLYCEDLSLSWLNEYILTLPSPSLSARKNITNLFGAITLEQQNIWILEGQNVPSTDYIGYRCTPIPTEILTFDMSTANTVSKVTNGVWKQGHRYLIECEGSYVDSDTPTLIGDAMYYHDTGTGTKTFSTLNFNFDGSITVPTQAVVPFASDHKYRFTIEKNPGSGNATRTVSRDNGTMNLPNVTGILTVTITDLGEFAD